jgi:hypothetical protein
MHRLITWAWLGLAAGVCGLLYEIIGHPYGDRFAIGIWPVPAGTPWTYQLLSGFIPALTVLSLATLLAGGYHHINCHEPGCPRIGKHKVNGTPWCNIHHEHARPEVSDNELLADIAATLHRIELHQLGEM